MTIKTMTIAEPLNKDTGFIITIDPETGQAVCGGTVPDIFHFPKIALEPIPPIGGPAVVAVDAGENPAPEISAKTDLPSEPVVVAGLGGVKDGGFVVTIDPKTGQAVCGPAPIEVPDTLYFPKGAIEPVTPVGGPLIVQLEPIAFDHDGGFVITIDPETGQAVCGGAYGALPKPAVADVPVTADTHEGITLVGADVAHPDTVTI